MKNLFYFIVLLFISCNSESKSDERIEITPFLIGKGMLFGNGQEGINQSNLVITSSDAWNNLIIQLDSNNQTSIGFSEINIDFSNFEIIAVFDEIRGFAESSIEIISIIENEDNIEVTIFAKTFGDATLINQPFYIVKIPKNEKPIVFLKYVG